MVDPSIHTAPLTYKYDVVVSDGTAVIFESEVFELTFRSVCETDKLIFNTGTPPSVIAIVSTSDDLNGDDVIDKLGIVQHVPDCETGRLWSAA